LNNWAQMYSSFVFLVLDVTQREALCDFTERQLRRVFSEMLRKVYGPYP